jgi:hypothetical protein
MNTHLDDLRAKLRLAMSSSLRVNESGTWGRSEAMSKELALLRARFGRPLAHRNTQSVEQAILRYRRTGRLPGYRDIKYVCAGVATEFSGWCLLQDAPLLDELLRTAEVGSDRLRLRYFSCLLHSYWSFPRDDARSSQASLDGRAVLRDWLAAQQRCLAASQKLKQPWFDTLNEHANLLTSEPCARYGQELLAGAGGGMNQAFERLGVPLDSWLPKKRSMPKCAPAPTRKMQPSNRASHG